jgi:branched-chain amino acid transport system substrate-binding protein
MNTKKVIFGIIAVGLIAATFMFSGCKGKSGKQDVTTVKIAVNMPMTGNLALYGESVRNGYSLAMEDLKDSLERYSINLSFDYQDNHGQSKDAITILQKHQLSGFDIYVSGLTQQTLAVKDKVESTKLPHIIWSFYPLILSEQEHLFRTYVDLPNEPNMFYEYLKQKAGTKKVACVYINDASAQELFNDMFIPSIKNDGYELVFNESFEFENTNYRDLVLKIKRSNPDIIFVNGFKNHLIQLAKEFNNNGMKKDRNIVFSFDIIDALTDSDPKLLEGYMANIPDYVTSNTKTKREWQNHYSEKFNRMPNFTDAFAYDCIMMIFSAIKIQKEEISLTLQEALHKVQTYGLTGPLAFEKNGNLFSPSTMCVVENGNLISVKK